MKQANAKAKRKIKFQMMFDNETKQHEGYLLKKFVYGDDFVVHRCLHWHEMFQLTHIATGRCFNLPPSKTIALAMSRTKKYIYKKGKEGYLAAKRKCLILNPVQP